MISLRSGRSHAEWVWVFAKYPLAMYCSAFKLTSIYIVANSHISIDRYSVRKQRNGSCEINKIGNPIEMSRCWATTPKRSIRKYRITYFRFRTPKTFNVHERFSDSIGWSAVIEFLMRFKPIVEIHKSIVRRNCYSTTDMTSSVTDETKCQRRRRRRPTVYSAQHYSTCVSYNGQPSAVCTLRYDFCLLSTKAGNYHSDEPRGVPSKLLLLHNSSD